ncbi:MAG TPA: STAS domain-containing protein [Fervidobacterium sp.]|nr:STAS domain-containing protein [Fervidobacterium sp.]
MKESSKLEQQLILGKIVEFKMPKEFDLNNSYGIKEYIYTEAFDKGYIHVLLDFSGTEYIDSTGLGTIVALHKQSLMKAGSIAFVNFDENIKKLLKMTALDRVLNIFESEKDAIEFLNR